jgi:hypothetical protein
MVLPIHREDFTPVTQKPTELAGCSSTQAWTAVREVCECPRGELIAGSKGVVLLTIIVSVALGATAFSALLVIALARVAALSDRDSERMLAEHLAAPRASVCHRGYAGLERAQATIARESSMAVPSSRIRVGTMRLPVSSCTSRRPRLVDRSRQQTKAVGPHHFWVVTGVPERVVGVRAWVTAGAQGHWERAPADIQLHETFSVPSMPAWRWPGTEQ